MVFLLNNLQGFQLNVYMDTVKYAMLLKQAKPFSLSPLLQNFDQQGLVGCAFPLPGLQDKSHQQGFHLVC